MEVIAEIGLEHRGSLDLAFRYIDAIQQAGAQTAKFQLHLPQHEPNAPLRVPIAGFKDRAGLWEATGFSIHEWRQIQDYCDQKGVRFLTSVFCAEAVELLHAMGVTRIKVPSGQLLSERLLDALSAAESHVLLSTGLHPWEEVSRALERLSGASTAVLACTTAYPTTPGQIDIPDWADGLSDHSGTIWPGIVAAWEGLDYLEVHVTFSRQMGGPDAQASLDMDELAMLIEGVSFVEHMGLRQHDEIVQAQDVRKLRKLFIPSELD